MTNRIIFHRLWLENLIYLALGLLVLGLGIFKFGESLLENVVSLVLGFVILSPLVLYPQHIEIDDHKLIISYLLRERIFTRREIVSIVLNRKVYRGGSYFALYIVPEDQKLISIANFNQSNPIIYEVLIKWHNTK